MPASDAQLEAVDQKKNVLERPSWDEYYLTIAYVVAQRSFDASSKCGCVLVSKDNRVLSTGYNGPLKHSIDEEIPLTRPEKYYHMLHGEENALLAYSGSHQDIQNSTAYITGRPCHKCLRMLLQKGITRIIYGENETKIVNEADMKAQELMLEHQRKWHGYPSIKELNNDFVLAVLQKTSNYIDVKRKQGRIE